MNTKLIIIIMLVIIIITAIVVTFILLRNRKSYIVVDEEINETLNEEKVDIKASKTNKTKKKKKDKKIEAVNKNGLVNYNCYSMNKKEKIQWALVGMAVLFVAAYIFYQDIIWALVCSLIGLMFPKVKVKDIINKRKKKLLMQFKEALYVISTSLSAGKSIENAFSDAKIDLETVFDFGEESYIIDELTYINRRLQMNQTIEEALEDFAERSGLEDIKTFANVFNTCKLTGGNLISVIEMTSRTIGEKITIKQDIETLISGKKFEANILGVIPFGIVLFIKISAPTFLSSLYTLPGRLLSTGALLVIAISILWGRKIMNIEV